MIFSFLLSPLAGLTARSQAANRPNTRGRTLAVEALETREMLSAAGIVDVGSQPSGALDDKIVYVHGGHGYVYNNNWGYQRPLLLDMIEDLGNLDQMSQFADTLWNTGATVVPLRPIGHQLNEVILDNDDVEVTFNGAWGNGSGSVYFGDSGDIRYKFAITSLTETATAVYRPTIAEEGFYPVYTWASYGANRSTDQLYRVHHTGGATEVTIDHSRVGNGLVYLGTYHFDAGDAGYVEISNQGSVAGTAVVADMIRFGNGMGDISRGGSISGVSRENESGLYWVQWHVDRAQGISDSEYRVSSNDRTASVSFSPRYAEYMNRSTAGTLSDRVFVSYHSNAGGGGSRGTLGLLNGNNDPNTATPNQFLLADLLAGQVNDDMVAQAGVYENNWFNRSVVTLDRSDIEFGEINNLRISNEFDATIIEVAFHDNVADTELMRDPKVRAAVARATTQGLVDYFNNVDGGATPNIDAPPEVGGVRVETTASGEVTLSWTPGTASSFAGDAADGYIIYASTDGLGFDGGTFVAGGGTTSHVLTGLDTNVTYYFKVVAYNGGGQSPGSEVLAAIPSASAKQVLVVNGFDRFDRQIAATEQQPSGGFADRIWNRHSNSFDYAIQVTEAIANSGASVALSTTSNEKIADGTISLDDYDAVFWILGEESTADDTFDVAEQAATAAYLSQGGKLFLSGAEIGWDLDNLNNGRSFYNNSLRADYASDDAGTYNVTGNGGSIFAGINFAFDDGSIFYNAEFPDVLTPLGGATSVLTYANAAGSAGIQYDGGASGERVIMFGFPFETITSATARDAIMAATLEFFDIGAAPVLGDYDGNGTVEQADHTLWASTFGDSVTAGTGADGNGNGVVDAADYTIWRDNLGMTASAAPAALAAPAVQLAQVSAEEPSPLSAPSAVLFSARGTETTSPQPVADTKGSTDDAATRQLARSLLLAKRETPASSEPAIEKGPQPTETTEITEKTESDRDQLEPFNRPKSFGKQL